MTPRFGTALLGLAAVLLGGSSLRADEPALSSAFKIRGLVSSTATSQGLSNGVLGHNLATGAGFGIELAYPMGKGRVSGEIGYSFIAGDAQLGSLSGMEVHGTGVTVTSHVDSRKNKLEGLTLRVGYEAPFSEGYSWRAGLQFGGNKFTHQVLGNVNGTSTTGNFADSYAFVGSKTSMAPSPYVGLTFAFDDASALEFGLTLLQYTSLNYRHVINTQNQLDSAPTQNRMLPTLEVAYVFRF